jgi:phage repressor protein C with HTH and peptisase S24 domain
MKTIAERLRYVREKMGIGQADASSKFGIPVSTYRKYETGPSEPGSDAIAGISRAGINANWLLTGEGVMLLSDVQSRPDLPEIQQKYSRVSDHGAFMPPVPHPGFIFVPRFEVEASMGNGSVIHSEQIVDYLAFREDWVRLELGLNPKNLFLISSVGDSMEPTLRTNDLLLIDRGSAEVKHDAIYCFVYNGELRVKRIQFKMSGILIVKSDNQQYEAEIIPLDQRDSIKIIGRVVWFGRGM